MGIWDDLDIIYTDFLLIMSEGVLVAHSIDFGLGVRIRSAGFH